MKSVFTWVRRASPAVIEGAMGCPSDVHRATEGPGQWNRLGITKAHDPKEAAGSKAVTQAWSSGAQARRKRKTQVHPMGSHGSVGGKSAQGKALQLPVRRSVKTRR